MKNTDYYHRSHVEHKLELKSFQKPYKCDGCKETGFGKRFRCDQCDFDLHENCMFLTDKTSHAFFKGSTFEFFEQPPRQCSRNKHCKECERYCDACGKPVKGFVYHCRKKGLDLHPCCSNLKEVVNIDGKTFRLCESVGSRCFCCGKVKIEGSVSGIRGWSYISTCNEYHLHVHCVTKMVSEVWKNRDKVSNDNENECLDLENLKLPKNLAKLRKDDVSGHKCWRIIKAFFRTIACILMGEPTITMTCLVVELLT